LSAAVHVHGGGIEHGGGATYLLSLAQELARGGDRGLRWRFGASPELAEMLASAGAEVAILPALPAWRRALWEQAALGREKTYTLLAAGNFGPLARSSGYLLLAQNALYFSEVPFTGPGKTRVRLEATLARASARRARMVITPSAAMANAVRSRTRSPVRPIPFGPGLAERRVPAAGARFTFLHRTPWGPHKGLTELLRAVRMLADEIPNGFVLRTACDPTASVAARYPQSAEQRRLLQDPIIRRHVHVSRFGLASDEQRHLAGDAVVIPSTTESFCFPLAEAMCFGLPVVASDRPFARELCGRAAIYFEPGDPPALARAMRLVVDGTGPPAPSAEQVRRLNWSGHVDALADACAAAAQP
jgi:glycosyltransferase involved in cell wall biosynthesis